LGVRGIDLVLSNLDAAMGTLAGEQFAHMAQGMVASLNQWRWLATASGQIRIQRITTRGCVGSRKRNETLTGSLDTSLMQLTVCSSQE